jgi:fibronectin-binding autotransporter adhesin
MTTFNWKFPVSGSWSTSNAWNPSGPPAADGDVVLGGVALGGYTVTLDTSTNNLDSLKISAFTGSPTILALGSNQLYVDGGGTDTITVSNNNEITVAGGGITAGYLTLSGSGTNVSGNGFIDAFIQGGMSASGTVTASGGGTLVLEDGASGVTLAIDSTAANVLSIDSDVTTPSNITINNANQILEISADLTITAATQESISNGTIVLDGGTFDDAAGLTLGSSSQLTGWGWVDAPITATGNGGNAPSIMATGGPLELEQDLTNYSNNLTLTIGAGSDDGLVLDGQDYATSLDFLGSTGTLELGSCASLTLTDALAIGANTVVLDGPFSTLEDDAGISMTAGLIEGAGYVYGPITTTGAATIWADGGGFGISGLGADVVTSDFASFGGTLEIENTVTDSGNALTLEIDSCDTLKLDATSTANNVYFNTSNDGGYGYGGLPGVLEVGCEGSLTVATNLQIGDNIVLLDGFNTTLTDANGVTLAGGLLGGWGDLTADTNLSGWGTVCIPLDVADTVTATANTANTSGYGGASLPLEFTNSVDCTTATTFDIAAGADLKFDENVGTAPETEQFANTVGSGSVTPPVTFEAAAGILDLSAESALSNFNGVVDGFQAGDEILVSGADYATLNPSGTSINVFDSFERPAWHDFVWPVIRRGYLHGRT